MNEESFVGRRERDWQRLSVLCNVADGRLSSLSSQELREFIRLYRRVSTDLALARTKTTNVHLISYLNDLLGQAYGILYRSPRKPFLATVLEALSLSAQTVRRCKWFLLTSASIFFGSALFVYGLAGWNEDVKQKLIPPSLEASFEGWKTGHFEEHSSSQSGMMAGFYASNNPRTSIITGAVGAGSFGLISVYLLFQNGALLGALGYEMSKIGKLGFLLSSISPHGVPELSGIIVAGATGLLLGFAIIHPGRKRRSDALRAVGKDAIVLLATSVVLMFIAAPIEAFFSFQPSVPQGVKVTVAVVSFCAWAIFWVGYGKPTLTLDTVKTA